MDNYYKILGVTSAATSSELRRAYRILARRYHPDLNPGEVDANTFKRIARAYEVLSDPEQRRQHDAELEKGREHFSSAFDRAHREYRKNQRPREAPRPAQAEPEAPRRAARQAKPAKEPGRRPKSKLSQIAATSRETMRMVANKILQTGSTRPERPSNHVSRLSLLEVSISIFDAIRGVRKTVEMSDSSGDIRKISAHIPAGVRTGSIVRFRRKESPEEEVVLVIRVAHHPWLSMSAKGLMMEIPITVAEAIQGGRIQVPSLGDPLLVTVEPGMQSGSEVRLRGQGIRAKDGSRGDLFIRFMVKVPEAAADPALREKSDSLSGYYSSPVRAGLPRSITDE